VNSSDGRQIASSLRRLFYMLFLRGRSSRGLNKKNAPQSVALKLGMALFIYALVGLLALSFIGKPVFALAICVHGLTFFFLGTYIASTSGEVLFNKDESDILLHRPVTAKQLLWAKIRVLIEISLFLAAAMNLAGLCVGGFATTDGGYIFPFAHALSVTLEAIFCAGSVVLVYQLCLRWFGRERLETLMTTAQVLIAVLATLAGQIMPRLAVKIGGAATLDTSSWWLGLLPPVWFAGFDDALAGSGSGQAWLLAAVGVAATALVAWLAFVKLADEYGRGMQAIGEQSSPPRTRPRRRWVETLAAMPPLRWLLRDPVSRASFVLCCAYIARDRDVKLRVYPSLAPMMILPVMLLFTNSSPNADTAFGVALAGGYLGLIPMLGLNILRYSQQWQASDVFRNAPINGPGPLCDGARVAVGTLLTAPMLIGLTALILLIGVPWSQAALLLPGLLPVPIIGLYACLGGKCVPLSAPVEEAQSTRRGVGIFVIIFASMAIGGIGIAAWTAGVFPLMIAIESAIVLVLYVFMRRSIKAARWPSMT
jgi:ABC-2 type transport system permease protein